MAKSFAMQLKLSELFDAFSLALDLSEGKQLGHARRTTSIALVLAMHHDLKGKYLDELYYTAMMHDIGLTGNSINTIMASDYGPLTRKQSLAGARIVSNIPYVENISPYIKHYHERWDGKGQPEGLAASEIPLISRVVNLADSIEIFLSSSGNNTESLKRYLRQEAGKKFDPELALIAHDVVGRDEFIETINHPIALLEDLRPRENVTINDCELLAIGKGFAEIVDSKSTFTAHHSKEVADYSVQLAKHLKLKKDSIYKIEVAGLLHDIGKLGISTDILHKPSQLSEAEFEQMSYHPYYSGLILKQINGFEDITNWAALHHEKLDGSGYPHHHLACDIPTEARIIAIADVFQALISDRPYRDGLSYHKVVDIMSTMVKDKHLDGDLFAEFLNIAPILIEDKLHPNMLGGEI